MTNLNPSLFRKAFQYLLPIAGWMAGFHVPTQLLAKDSVISSTRKPNVLFIAVDDLSDWTGFLGNHPQADTPVMDRLAKQGTVFANAHCAAPICNPSRAAVLTGLNPTTSGMYFLAPRHGEAKTLQNREDLFSFFSGRGYTTYLTGKIYHHKKDPRENQGGKIHHLGPLFQYGPTPESKLNWPTGHPLWDWGVFPEDEENLPDHRIANQAVTWLEGAPEAPFFMAVGFVRPHVPFFTTQRWFDQVPKEEEILLPDYGNVEPVSEYVESLTVGLAAPRHEDIVRLGEWRNAVRSYLASVRYVDYEIGQVLEALDKSGLAENTIIVLWSDHGVHLGERQRWGKRSLWERSTHTPLLIRVPGSVSGQVSRKPVGLVDLFPTLSELCGFVPPEKLDGQSLVPLLNDPDRPWPRPALTTFGPGNYSLRTERWRFTVYADGSEELYDHSIDPHELVNLVKNPEFKALIDLLKEYLPVGIAPQLPGSAGADTPVFPPLPMEMDK